MPIFLNSRKFVHAVGGKSLHIPKEGWNAQNFALYGEQMILTLARVAKITQRRAAPGLAQNCKAMFRGQIHEINRRVLSWSRSTRTAKAPTSVTLDLPQNAELWVEAMNEVFADAGLDAIATILPPVQSVMGQAYSKTSIILGQEPDEVARIVTTQSRSIARKITAISETTRKRITAKVVESIEAGLTVVETAQALEDAAPEIYGNRSLTIARTELNNAWTKGTLLAMGESRTITHFSVIGCEAREANSPQYNGESTCNIQDIAINETEEFLAVGFHPNHTGNIIPSRFRNDDGTFDADGPRPEILAEAEQIAEEQAADTEAA